jgi:hypothetical protein
LPPNAHSHSLWKFVYPSDHSNIFRRKELKRIQMTFLPLCAIVIALVLLPSCTKDNPTAPPPLPLPPSATGSWSGTLTSGGTTGPFALTLSQEITRISGSGMLGTISMTVSGEAHCPDVQFTCTAARYAPFVFTGTFTSPTTISGLVNGSGFVNAAVALTKD